MWMLGLWILGCIMVLMVFGWRIWIGMFCVIIFLCFLCKEVLRCLGWNMLLLLNGLLVVEGFVGFGVLDVFEVVVVMVMDSMGRLFFLVR